MGVCHFECLGICVCLCEHVYVVIMSVCYVSVCVWVGCVYLSIPTLIFERSCKEVSRVRQSAMVELNP